MRLGLRERLVGVLAIVSALTLAVAALALFRPLDTLVRRASRDSLTPAPSTRRSPGAGPRPRSRRRSRCASTASR
jgi:hypothetical protein